MVEIGGRPIIWHIMHIFSGQGHRDFIVACGYKGEVLKAYFSNFTLHNADLVANLGAGTVAVENQKAPDWRVSLVDTGHSTETGGRIKRLKTWLGEDAFFLTYGDGVGNVDLRGLLAFHRRHGRLATITAVRPPARFGGLTLEKDAVVKFNEKVQVNAGWINGGFMVLEPDVLDYIDGDNTVFEKDPLERLATEGELMAFRHQDFWQPMDTLRDKHLLNELWRSGNAPWDSRKDGVEF
jgi:glucose-1-phosphate cytidylyltransferase